MMEKTANNFEAELPSGYVQVYHIDAKSKKTGLVLNLVSLIIMAIVMVIAVSLLSLRRGSAEKEERSLIIYGVTYVVFLISMIAYIVLHELVHGAAYKALTGGKLTFGMSWSCAFCGVPGIFTYRRTALIALAAPFTVFSILLLALTAAVFFVHPFVYLASALLFAIHLGGCSGDLYMMILLLFKFKDKKLLMKDTGPEQFLYVPKSEK